MLRKKSAPTLFTINLHFACKSAVSREKELTARQTYIWGQSDSDKTASLFVLRLNFMGQFGLEFKPKTVDGTRCLNLTWKNKR